MGCINAKIKNLEETLEKSLDSEMERRRSSHSFRNNLLWERDFSKFHQNYKIVKRIGEGSMGSIFHVIKKSTKQNYALKTIILNRVSNTLVEELQNEIEILRNLDHPNIIRCHEVFQKQRQIYLILELCTGGDLYERRYNETSAKSVIKKLCQAIAYCHENGVTHRDLKFENILYDNKDENAEIKLIDFGLGKLYSQDDVMHRAVGTMYTMAPEVLKKCYTEACDLWSIGVITYMLLVGKPPFDGENESEIACQIKSGVYDRTCKNWNNISKNGKEFVRNLLQVDPLMRPSIQECLFDKWFEEKVEEDSLQAHGTDENILTSLRNFSNYGKFKRIALMVLAYTLDGEKIRQLREAFRAFDKSNNGTLSMAEVQQVLMKNCIDEEEISHIFKEMDQDQSGQIDYMEFIAATLEANNLIQEERLLQVFHRLDADETGFISSKNLKDILGRDYSEHVVQQMMNEVDLDKNGTIDINEFLQVMKKSKQMISPSNIDSHSSIDVSSSLEQQKVSIIR